MNENERILYHMAAILYNAEFGNTKRTNILKKVIESILAINGNEYLTCAEISVEAKNRVHMILVEEEIEDIIKEKDKHFEIDYSLPEMKVCLAKNRYNYIMDIGNRNMESYVNEFIQLNGYGQEKKI